MTDINAKLSGQFLIGGEIPINRLGFGALRITGPGVLGEPEDHQEAINVLRRLPELGVTLSIRPSYGPFVSADCRGIGIMT